MLFAGALNNIASLSVIDVYPDSSENNDLDMHNDDVDPNDDEEDDTDDEYLDKIASLKTVKRKRIKRKEMTEEEAEEFNQVLKKSNLKVKDFVK